MTRDELWVCHLGMVPYLDAVALQERVRAQRQAGELPDTLLLLEHPPVYTRGRRSGAGELTLGEDFYRARGIDVVDTDRGGRITYHGPGQLVGYPIMRVADIGSHLRTMEGAIVAALAEEGIAAHSRCAEGPDYTGVWVGPRKIASIGVHVSRGIATHGFAVNATNDLDPFSWVVACGLPDVAMTSIARETSERGWPISDRSASSPIRGQAVARVQSTPRELPVPVRVRPGLACPEAPLDRFRRSMAHAFSEAHGRRQRLVSPRRLGIDASIPSSPARRVAMPA